MHLMGPVLYDMHKIEQDVREARLKHRWHTAHWRPEGAATPPPTRRARRFRLAGTLGLF